MKDTQQSNSIVKSVKTYLVQNYPKQSLDQ
jgi:hypothetical protein